MGFPRQPHLCPFLSFLVEDRRRRKSSESDDQDRLFHGPFDGTGVSALFLSSRICTVRSMICGFTCGQQRTRLDESFYLSYSLLLLLKNWIMQHQLLSLEVVSCSEPFPMESNQEHKKGILCFRKVVIESTFHLKSRLWNESSVLSYQKPQSMWAVKGIPGKSVSWLYSGEDGAMHVMWVTKLFLR